MRVFIAGHAVLLDEADAHLLSAHRWRVEYSGKQGFRRIPYVVTGHGVRLHRLIVQPFAHQLVDHHDGDSLNNTRENLRPCTHAQNMMNRRFHINNRSGSKGVWWDEGRRKWRAEVKAEGRRYNLGRFDAKEAAVATYQAAARRLHGDFCSLDWAVPELIGADGAPKVPALRAQTAPATPTAEAA